MLTIAEMLENIREYSSSAATLFTLLKQENKVFTAEEKKLLLNFRDSSGQSLLHWACSFYGDIPSILLLLQIGIPVNAINNVGETAYDKMMYSLYGPDSQKKSEIKKILISHGATIVDPTHQYPKDLVTFESLCKKIDERNQGLQRILHIKSIILKSPLFVRLSYGPHTLTKTELIEFEAFKTKKRMAWELVQKQSEKYLARQLSRPEKTISIEAPDGTQFNFIDLRDKSDYQFFLHDSKGHVHEELSKKGSTPLECLKKHMSFIKDTSHFSISLLDKNTSTYLTTSQSKSIFTTINFVLKINPQALFITSPRDVWSSCASAYSKDESSLAEYVKTLTGSRDRVNFLEFMIRKIWKEYTDANSLVEELDQNTLQAVLYHLELLKPFAQGSKNHATLHETPDLTPGAVLSQTYHYNELLVKGDPQHDFVGILFEEMHVPHLAEEIARGNDYYYDLLKLLKDSGLPLILVRHSKDPDYKLTSQEKSHELKAKFEKMYRTLDEIITQQNRYQYALEQEKIYTKEQRLAFNSAKADLEDDKVKCIAEIIQLQKSVELYESSHEDVPDKDLKLDLDSASKNPFEDQPLEMGEPLIFSTISRFVDKKEKLDKDENNSSRAVISS